MTQPVLAYYADDFTGATDVLDAFGRLGVPSDLYLTAPDVLPDDSDAMVVGVAGLARQLSRQELPGTVRAELTTLKSLDPAIVQYKVCSTFDSSPETGSIGAAAELGAALFDQAVIPVVIGVPMLGRYVVFSNLFARASPGDDVYRLDRHPVMSRHPVTPMDEADLTRVLRRQTSLDIRAADIVSLHRDQPLLDDVSGRSLCVIDTVDDHDLRAIGTAIWEAAGQAAAPYFTVGSSGLDYALLYGWNERHPVPPRRASRRIRGARSVLAVSGSRSSVTSAQIALAVRLGYCHVRVAADDGGAWESGGREAVEAISAGQSVIVDVGSQPLLPGAQTVVARRLGELTSRLVGMTGCQRLVVCGGDTSSAVARALGAVRTQFLMPMSPGVPLCSVERGGGARLEVAFKGGQLGQPDLFERVRLADNSQDAGA